MYCKIAWVISILAIGATSDPVFGDLIGVTVRFVPPNQTVSLGDVFNVQIVADIGSPVVGWGLDFGIANPLILSQAAPSVIDPTWYAAAAPDGDGLAALAFPNSISGAGIVLATLTLHADLLGATDLHLSTTPGDQTEGFALDPTGFSEIAFQTGHVTVVPEPATLVLLVMAAVGAAIRSTSSQSRRHSERKRAETRGEMRSRL